MRSTTLATIVYVLAGPIAWALHVTVIYAFQSTACVVHPGPEGLVDTVIALATVIAAGATLFVALRPDAAARVLGAGTWSPAIGGFNRQVTTLLAGLSTFGILGAGAATFILPACEMMR